MGDVGYLDEPGRLWFCGRKSHRVVTPHGTLFTDMVEPVFNTVAGRRREPRSSACTRSGVTYPVLCVSRPVEPSERYRRSDRESSCRRLRETRGQRSSNITRRIDDVP